MDMAMDILATDMVVMDTMDIMARGPLMLSPAMDMVTTDTMARDQLMLNQDMDTMAMDMVMDTMAMDMDIMVRQEPSCCCFLEFSTTEVDQNRSSQKQTHFLTQGNKYL